MDEDTDFEGEEEYPLFPERLTRWVFVRAGLELASHVVGGVQCAIGIVGNAVLAAEVYESEKKSFEESVRADYEMLPETE